MSKLIKPRHLRNLKKKAKKAYKYAGKRKKASKVKKTKRKVARKRKTAKKRKKR